MIDNSLEHALEAAEHDAEAAVRATAMAPKKVKAAAASGELRALRQAHVLQPDLVGEVFGVRADRLRHPATGRLWLAFSPRSEPASPNGHR